MVKKAGCFGGAVMLLMMGFTFILMVSVIIASAQGMLDTASDMLPGGPNLFESWMYEEVDAGRSSMESEGAVSFTGAVLVALTQAELDAFYEMLGSMDFSDLFASDEMQLWMRSWMRPTSSGQLFQEIDVDPSFVCAPLIAYENTYRTDAFYSTRVGADGVDATTWDHSGIDFGTGGVNGLPTITPMGGAVTYAGILDANYGFVVIVENQGYQVMLAHGMAAYVSVGDVVTAGQVVMASGGGTGNPALDGSSSGSHVHFETRYCEETDAGTTCYFENPNLVTLPGQTAPCLWDLQVTNPELNWQFSVKPDMHPGQDASSGPELPPPPTAPEDPVAVLQNLSTKY